MALRTSTHSKSGTTLVETLVAVALIAAFFSAIFEVNAICLRFINASKESVGAMQGAQDRLEQLRNLDFTSLTTVSSMTTLLTTPANTSPLAAQATERVVLTGYPSGSPTITYTRNPGASVTPSASPSSVDFGSTSTNTTLVKVDVIYSWNMALGGRPRTAQASTILSSGTKK